MFDNYITQYGRRLYGLCITLCANRQDADDLYQDTWLKAYERIHRYRPEFPFEPWLTTICVNLFRDRLRRTASSPIFDNFQTAEEKEYCMERIPAKEQEDFSYVRDAINHLPEKLRMTVILFYFCENDVSRTAKLLKIPEGTVKSRLSKSRKLLKEVLQNEFDL